MGYWNKHSRSFLLRLSLFTAPIRHYNNLNTVKLGGSIIYLLNATFGPLARWSYVCKPFQAGKPNLTYEVRFKNCGV